MKYNLLQTNIQTNENNFIIIINKYYYYRGFL